jgi:hypothetical protein
MSPVDQRFDDLSKALAGKHSRRSVLKAGLGLAGAALASALPGRAWADPGGNSAAAHFCNTVLPPGEARGRCKSTAAQGGGLFVQCGGDPTRICPQPTAPDLRCCPPGTTCCGTSACCGAGEVCNPATQSCEPACTPCPGTDGCCPPGESCCSFGRTTFCCPPNTFCCTSTGNGACCPEGSKCCIHGPNVTCCPADSACCAHVLPVCCPPGQVCSPCPEGSFLPSICCPGGQACTVGAGGLTLFCS